LIPLLVLILILMLLGRMRVLLGALLFTTKIYFSRIIIVLIDILTKHIYAIYIIEILFWKVFEYLILMLFGLMSMHTAHYVV